jgi:hypothetical protein
MVIPELMQCKGIRTSNALILFPLSLLELFSSFVELHFAYLRVALLTPVVGKTSATVHSDAARESHEDGGGKGWVQVGLNSRCRLSRGWEEILGTTPFQRNNSIFRE